MNQLLFLYIEDYQDFGTISINFSNSFHINYENEDLTILKTPNLVKDLYGENILDINVIAGQNGIGKTTLLKAIADITREKDRYSDGYNYKYIQVVKTGDRTGHIYSTLAGELPLNVTSKSLDIKTETHSTYEPGRPIVYYSPFLDFNLLDVYSQQDGKPVFDLSQTQIMMDDMEDKERGEDEGDFIEPYSLLSHKLNNIKRHLNFIKNSSQIFKLPFDLPNVFWINFHRLNADRNDISINDKKIYDDLQALCAEYFRGFPKNKLSRGNMAQLMFLRNLLTLFFKSVTNIKTQGILHHSFKNFPADEIANFQNNSPEDLIRLMVRFFEQQDVFKSNIFIQFIEIAFQVINSDSVKFRNANNLLTVELSLSSQVIDRIFSVLNDAQHIPENKAILKPLSGFVSFDWNNFSSGEKMFLDLFSRLNSLKSRLPKTRDPILLIIDEGEIGFHPSWQLKYVENLVKFLNSCLPANSFQILLATHSPLVLSDFPKERAHLLWRAPETGLREKINSIGTFAQNTSELLANDFFVETSLIGNLAKHYIDEIISRISNLVSGQVMPKEVRAIYNRIELIDEPIIKKLLLNELERKANA